MNMTPDILAPSAPELRRSPLPDRARSPLLLFLAAVVPQSVLILLNLRSYFLMAGEMTGDQSRTAILLFVLEAGLLGGTAALAWRFFRLNRPVPWALYWLIFVPHAAYLGLATLAIGEGKVVPAAVALWIVPTGQFLFHQWVFLMPAAFLSALSLACYPTRSRRWAEMAACLGLTAGVPAAWYLALAASRGISPPEALIIVLAVGSSLICLGAFLRLMTCLYVWAEGGNRLTLAALVLVAGLLGPLGGLLLNARIPFPTDFQSPFLYALALLNGLLLLIPGTNHVVADRVVWLARWAMFPFTAYFFLVYLPFLPLAIPAMVFFGAGFLILAPTALLIVHGRAVLGPLQREIRDGLGKQALLWAALAASLLPATVAGLAWFDRENLHRAMDYIFTPDYRRDVRFDGNLWATRRALEGVRDQKISAYRPFLSEFYDAAVFQGLTLGTAKLQALHQTFFGRPLEMPAPEGLVAFRNRRRMTETPRTGAASFPRDVRLENLTAASRVEDGCTATTVTLTLQNMRTVQSEYVVEISVPPGVMVSGYWLHVGTERVPGQIFEKKTALWVYRMIRDVTRQDPGVLTYTSPTTLELRVFPFSASERRVTEIEFLSPPGLAATVSIGSRTVPIVSPTSGPALVSQKGRGRLVVPGEAAAALPQITRRPYLHFIIERSAGSSLTVAETLLTLQQVARNFPAATDCRVTAANYEISDLTPDLVPLASLDRLAEAPASRWLPARGAFLRDRAIKRVLLQYHDRFSVSRETDSWFGSYPLIVVIRDSGREVPGGGDLSWFASLAPDADHFYTVSKNGPLTAEGFDGRPMPGEPAAARPVQVFRAGNTLAAAGAEVGGGSVLNFDGPVVPNEIAVFDPTRRVFEPVAGIVPVRPESRYARGEKVWQEAAALRENPSLAEARLPELIRASRDAGILLPDAAYIVVENSAQGKILRLREQQKLGGKREFDFLETPEPSAALVGLLAGLLLLAGSRRACRRGQKPAA